ncbi:hypothetical protein GOBAR_DD05490 [Gossypium barbadense]|nr:hypothetical protein GOBAR_DD05490 [Gossypium barbadense]
MSDMSQDMIHTHIRIDICLPKTFDRPGLLLSTMRALDNLGLDIQQAVINYFNGFALDVFRAEQCREGQDVLPEQIKAVLLDSAGFRGIM